MFRRRKAAPGRRLDPPRGRGTTPARGVVKNCKVRPATPMPASAGSQKLRQELNPFFHHLLSFGGAAFREPGYTSAKLYGDPPKALKKEEIESCEERTAGRHCRHW